ARARIPLPGFQPQLLGLLRRLRTLRGLHVSRRGRAVLAAGRGRWRTRVDRHRALRSRQHRLCGALLALLLHHAVGLRRGDLGQPWPRALRTRYDALGAAFISVVSGFSWTRSTEAGLKVAKRSA